MMDEGYKIDAGTIKWAEKRTRELGASEADVGSALEKMDQVLSLLHESMQKMWNQPESEMAHDWEKRLAVIKKEMDTAFVSWRNDKDAILAGISEFREGLKRNG